MAALPLAKAGAAKNGPAKAGKKAPPFPPKDGKGKKAPKKK